MNSRLLVALFIAITTAACAPLNTQQTADNESIDSPNLAENRLRGVEARLDRIERQLEGMGNLDLVEQVQRLQQETRDLRGNLEQNSHNLETLQTVNSQKVELTKAPTVPLKPLDFPELPGPANEQQTPEVAPAPSQFEIPSDGVPESNDVVASSPTAPVVKPEVDSAAASLGFGAPVPQDPTPIEIPVPTTSKPAAVVDNVQERGSYDSAFDLLKNGRYGDSIIAFEGFLKQYPQGEYAGNAQYWLGEAHYVTRSFDAAVREFTKVIDNYPTSLKYADSLLKLGYVHYELKQWQKARARLAQVIDKFPGTTVAKLAQQRLDRIRREGN